MLKYLPLALLLATMARPALAQTTPASSSTTGQYQYCTLEGNQAIGRSARLDYGQHAKPATTNLALEEINKAVQKLDSPILALNYMTTIGWEYVGVTSTGTNSIVYVLRKRIQ